MALERLTHRLCTALGKEGASNYCGLRLTQLVLKNARLRQRHECRRRGKIDQRATRVSLYYLFRAIDATDTDLAARLVFVRCDVTKWEDQVDLFHTAANITPSKTVDHVVANAGIAIDDEVFSFDGTLQSLASTCSLSLADCFVVPHRPGSTPKRAKPQDDRSQP